MLDPNDLVAMERMVQQAVKIEVNSKIDHLREDMNTHMERALPAIEAFESWRQESEVAARNGKRILWISGFITAVGGAYLVVKGIFFS